METLKTYCTLNACLILHYAYSNAWAVDVAVVLLPSLTCCCQGAEPSQWDVCFVVVVLLF